MTLHERQDGVGRQPNADEARSQPAPIMLAELSSPAFALAQPDLDLVMIPVGAHEQHGPALPVSTDALTAQVLCGLVGAILSPRVAVAPTIPWGVSWSHLGMPGTISLHEETLISIVEDVVTSLHGSGVQRFLVVNTHGGNNAALQVAVERCHRHHQVPVVACVDAYTFVAEAAAEVLSPEAVGHAGGDESAVIMAIRPDLVDESMLGKRTTNTGIQQVQSTLREARGTLPVAYRQVTASGATGDSSGASIATGSAIIGQATSRLRQVVQDLIALDLAPFGGD
jgi:creatinine amidohydrolase